MQNKDSIKMILLLCRMLKITFFASLFFIIHLSAFAQVTGATPAYDTGRFLREREDAARFKRKANRFDRKSWMDIYSIYMKDGSILKVNSNIFINPASGKHFLYSSGKDSVSKIYPDQTIKLIKQNPYYKIEEMPVEGTALDSCWRFKVITGKINGYSSFFKSVQLNEFQLNNGKIISIGSKELEALLISNKKAYAAFLIKDYYRAVKIYNQISGNR
ncbi:MAG: hypothetical protein JWN56_2995 [Sphingobacteriales bacterium]|nr:hypothetical protein [Sphingobacteriales bacterium]